MSVEIYPRLQLESAWLSPAIRSHAAHMRTSGSHTIILYTSLALPYVITLPICATVDMSVFAHVGVHQLYLPLSLRMSSVVASVVMSTIVSIRMRNAKNMHKSMRISAYRNTFLEKVLTRESRYTYFHYSITIINMSEK
jgi:hypothetical protein